jgi:ArsR family transcriptional regulator
MEEAKIKALGEVKRIELLRLLAERSWCVRALARRSGLSEPAVSQHLRVLREAGLVEGIKRGYYTHYRLNKEGLNEVIDALVRLRDTERIPCDRPYYGCPEAEHVRCRAYALAEERKENT